MPYVQINTIKGMLNTEQKQRLLEKIADVLMEVEGGGNTEFKKSIWINIQESEAEAWSMSGLRPSSQQIAQFTTARDTKSCTQNTEVTI
ncbi:tautomerase family protein [Undibacterium pigrum]|uniref:4-oxalocrotonate tautomerase n=1 Tax=Undibacterium pigrum TaxID=401470 RepID=A0A318JCG4_9BURK|nr:tautomerase family protein [Undibacterium pigrum]PXX45286.1 4-oxalocrotonate tautomerase [Undibacterium pigrum]